MGSCTPDAQQLLTLCTVGALRQEGRDAADGYSAQSELRVNLPAEDLLRIKKGWLLRRTEKHVSRARGGGSGGQGDVSGGL